jgi:hypothetical protein
MSMSADDPASSNVGKFSLEPRQAKNTKPSTTGGKPGVAEAVAALVVVLMVVAGMDEFEKAVEDVMSVAVDDVMSVAVDDVVTGRPLEVAGPNGAAMRTTSDTITWDGLSPQVSMIWSTGLLETRTAFVTRLVVAPAKSIKVELYTVCPSRVTARLQSVAIARLRCAGAMVVTSISTATPCPAEVSGAVVSTVSEASPLAGGERRTAVSPLNVVS